MLKHKRFVFDLDRTIWDCFDKHGNQIWAKQMIFPYTTKNDQIVDDVGSYCLLKTGIRNFLEELEKQEKEISFLSTGRLAPATYQETQPSIILLKLFGLITFFNSCKFLLYKTEEKADYLRDLSPCIFFDDDEENLIAANKIEGVTAIDSKITDWGNVSCLIENLD